MKILLEKGANIETKDKVVISLFFLFSQHCPFHLLFYIFKG